MIQKYVHFSRIGFVIWPDTDDLWHVKVGSLANYETGAIISAGFVEFSLDKSPRCFGKSQSLGIVSKPTDSEDLAAQLYGGK